MSLNPTDVVLYKELGYTAANNFHTSECAYYLRYSNIVPERTALSNAFLTFYWLIHDIDKANNKGT